VSPHVFSSVQQRSVARSAQTGARSAQHFPPVSAFEQYFSSGQHGPSSLLISVPSERVPPGQHRITPKPVNWRSGGQHSKGALSLPIGLAHWFGGVQQEPVPGAALQHAEP
jgi:hypothetical protein